MAGAAGFFALYLCLHQRYGVGRPEYLLLLLVVDGLAELWLHLHLLVLLGAVVVSHVFVLRGNFGSSVLDLFLLQNGILELKARLLLD